MRRGRYYLSRVKKHGMLDNTKVMNALTDSPTINVGKFAWTITDVEDKRESELSYVFGYLAKFSLEGYVPVVDTETKSSVEVIAQNLLVAKTPFVYLPDYSGIAFMHSWNGITEDIFPKRIENIINTKYGNFFVDCSVDPISDYRAFSSKLRKLEKISEIQAKVHPPNPLFGRLWGSLNEYINERNATEVQVKENCTNNEGLKTKLIDLINNLLKNSEYQPNTPPAIADAAILMAADGYGRGRVSGEAAGEEVIIRTSETHKSFLFSKTPIPEKLAIRTGQSLSTISKERNMKHK